MKKKLVKEEKDLNSTENTTKKITPDELIKKIILMDPAQVLSFITKQSGYKSGKEMLLKYSPSLTTAILKHGFYKTKDLAKSVKDFNKKNIEDNSKINFENVEIDTDTLKTIYVFDGDSIQKLEEFIKQYQESMKDIEAEATQAGEKLKSDVQAKKVKVSDETLDNNGLTVAGIIKNPENKDKSGKELTKEINQRVELENKITDSMKTTKEQLKKLDKLNLPEISEKDIEAAFKNINSTDNKSSESSNNKSSDDSDDYNKRHEEIHKIEETITKSIKNKLGKDYQSSLDVKIYPTSVFKKSIEQKIPKIVIDAIKARYTLGVRIDFFGDESDTVLEADEKGKYVVKLIKDDEKNPDIKKIVDTFKNIIKSTVDSKDIEGKVYAYLKYWKGENPDANFDSLFIFMGFTKFNIKESFGESNMINEVRIGATTTSSGTALRYEGHEINLTHQDYLNPKVVPPNFNSNKFIKMMHEMHYEHKTKRTTGLTYILNKLKKDPDNEDLQSLYLEKSSKMRDEIDKLYKWVLTLSDKDLENPKTQIIAAMILKADEDLNDKSYDYVTILNDNYLKTLPDYDPDIKNTENIAELSNNEETKEMTKGFLDKIGSGLKAFMNVIAVAKIAKFVLNHGKTFTDVLGAQLVKFKEDKNIIAEVTCILNNAEGSDSNYSDTKFSVRFDVNDLKWHATNLDNRKMKITNEDALIKKIMEVPEVKAFKTKCLETWTKIFDPKQTDNAIIPYFLKNYEKLGMKIDDKNMKKYIESLVKVANNFETIKKQFEGK